jgi:DNA-binding transcriptional LysR family regulator
MRRLASHRFVGPNEETPRAPYYRWLTETVPDANIVFRASDMRAVKEAVIAGHRASGSLPGGTRTGPKTWSTCCRPMEEWSARIWLVTHMDLHRTAKVQSFVRHLKSEVMTWPVDKPGGK